MIIFVLMSKKPLTNKEAIYKLNSLGLKYDFSKFEYNGSRLNKSVVICPIHGEFITNFHYIIKSHNGLVCKKCRNEHQQTKLFENQHGKDFNHRNNLIKVINNIDNHNINIDLIPEDIKYGSRSQIKLICKSHGEFLINYRSLIDYKSNCPDCIKENNIRGKRTYDIEFLNKIAVEHQGKCLDAEYLGFTHKHRFKCKNGNIFRTSLRMILNKDVWCRCKLCKPDRRSKGEDRIKDFLDDNKILYINEKRFDDLLSDMNMKVSFDFYLPEHNTCIEFDGKHHYKPINYFGGKKIYERMVINDNLKNEYCQKNNIRLIRIPYYNIDKINQILIKKLLYH